MILLILLIWLYFTIKMSFVNIKYLACSTYDSKLYVSNFKTQKYLYYPTWVLIENKDDLKDNELGIDLSKIDLSGIDFNQNNIIISLGAKVLFVKYYNNGQWVDILGIPTEENSVYIYKIDKIKITKNELMRPSGMFYSIFEYLGL